MEQINTEGLVQVGELTTRVMREAQVELDYRNAEVTGAVHAFNAVASFAAERISVAGPYDDTRALQELQIWIADRIREIQHA